MKKTLVCSLVLLVAALAHAQEAGQPRFQRSLRPNGLRPVSAASAAAPAAASTSEADAADPKEAPALNWDATPVDIVFQTYGEQVGKTILKDPSVPNATITLKSREGQKLSKEEYLEAIEVVLEMNGIHLEPYGEKFIRAVPRGKARKEGIPLYMDIADVPEDAKDGRVISVMISFKSIATDEAQKALENFKSDTGALNVFERTNSILVTDTWQNIKRMDEIAKSIDISSPVLEQVFVYQVENASANDIKQALEQIVQESQKELEKNGKGVQNNANSQSNFVRPTSLGGPRLLGSNRNQPEQPKPVESTVTAMSDADRGMIRGKVLILADERSNKLVIITSKSNYDFFEKVIKQLDVETTPDTVVKVYRLKYAEADEVADMINDLIGNAPSAKNSTKGNQNAAAKGQGGTTRVSTPTGASAANSARKSANQRTGDAKPGELSKENTTVLADKRINGLVVMTNKELVPVVESIIESMDVKLSQVLIETVIIEVTLGDDLKTGIDWVQRGRSKSMRIEDMKDSLGRTLYYPYKVESVDGETTALGDQLFRLTARAYIPRTEGNRELIEAIEAGIVKEVSVGCSMGHTLCSVCRNDMRSPLCSHHKGREYDGAMCYGELTDPQDAYEFSFVAVPAQRSAGVIKTAVKEKDMNDICKTLESGQDVALTKSEAEKLRAYIGSLEEENEYAKAYREELNGRLRAALKEKGIALDFAIESCVLKKLSLGEAQALLKALCAKERKAVPQLYVSRADDNAGNTEFRI